VPSSRTPQHITTLPPGIPRTGYRVNKLPLACPGAALAVKRAAGYSFDMPVWQYAQLRVTYDNRLAASGGKWTIDWHGPDATPQRTVEVYGEVVTELNRAGTKGWELGDVATLAAEHSGHFSEERDWSLTRYTFRRPYDSAAKSSEHSLLDETARSQATRTSQPEHPPTGSMTEEAALVTVTAYWLQDREPAGSTTEDHGLGSAAGRLLIRREAAHPRSQADIGLITLFRLLFEDPDISADRRDRIKAAAADYAASRVESQFGVTWWATPPNVSLSQAAGLLDRSADWLRDLVEHPLARAASTAGTAGPIDAIGAGITADYVTAPLTAPLEDAARICELAGIVIGLATGAHPLVIACAKRLAHDEVGQVLSRGFEQAFSSIDAGHDSHVAAPRDPKVQSPEPPHPEAPAVRKPDPRGTRGVANDPETQERRKRLLEGLPWPPDRPRAPRPTWPSGRRPPRPQPAEPSGPEPPGPSGPGAPGPSGPQRPGPSGPGAPGV
jgi:hypothetical protein